LHAQTPLAGKLAGAMDVKQHKHNFSFRNATNEATFVLTGAFIFYKSFISSQDGGACTFTPSCSEYGLLAVEKKGVVMGVLATFDRLTRCNGLSPSLYRYDYNKKLFIDPVD
jgi:uncharacterized protein